MEDKVKLIWDFRGSESEKFAEHHEIHLKQYLEKNQLHYDTGFDGISEMHSIAYLVVERQDMIKFRDALRPHRAELYETT
ncbi:MAG: hypothetical protein MRY83_01395 [Flavobacteriales bacterium]|nr:hypothetical protein [Flavobacteriales bacterium]